MIETREEQQWNRTVMSLLNGSSLQAGNYQVVYTTATAGVDQSDEISCLTDFSSSLADILMPRANGKSQIESHLW